MRYRNALVIGSAIVLGAVVISANPFTTASASGPQDIHTGTNYLGKEPVDIETNFHGNALQVHNNGRGDAVSGFANKGAGVQGYSVNGTGGTFTGKTGIHVNGSSQFIGNISVHGEVNASSFQDNGTEMNFYKPISGDELAASGSVPTPVLVGNGQSVDGYRLSNTVSFIVPQDYPTESVELNLVVPTAGTSCVLSLQALAFNAPDGKPFGTPETIPVSPQTQSFAPGQTQPNMDRISVPVSGPAGSFTAIQVSLRTNSTCFPLAINGGYGPPN
jgi:hypothetical protein